MESQNISCTFSGSFEEKNLSFLNILHVVLEVIFSILATSGNLIVLIVFFRESKLRREINFYIISLAISDLLNGAVAIPLHVATIVHPMTNSLCNLNFCLLKLSIFFSLANTTVLNLVLISVKRLKVLSVRNHNTQLESTAKISMEIGICWIVAIFIGSMPLYVYNRASTTCYLYDILKIEFVIFRFITVGLIPSIIMGIVYMKIYRFVVSQGKKKLTLKKTIKARELREERKFDDEIKVTISFSIIVIIFLISAIPLQISYLISFFIDKTLIPPSVVKFFVSLLHFNSAINPIIYAFRMRDIRRAIYRLFGVKSMLINSSTTY